MSEREHEKSQKEWKRKVTQKKKKKKKQNEYESSIVMAQMEGDEEKRRSEYGDKEKCVLQAQNKINM